MVGAILTLAAFLWLVAAIVTGVASETLDPDSNSWALRHGRDLRLFLILCGLWPIVLASALRIHRTTTRAERHAACIRNTKQLERQVYGEVVSQDLLDPAGIIIVDRPLSDREYKDLLNRWREQQRGR